MTCVHAVMVATKPQFDDTRRPLGWRIDHITTPKAQRRSGVEGEQGKGLTDVDGVAL